MFGRAETQEQKETHSRFVAMMLFSLFMHLILLPRYLPVAWLHQSIASHLNLKSRTLYRRKKWRAQLICTFVFTTTHQKMLSTRILECEKKGKKDRFNGRKKQNRFSIDKKTS